MFGSKRSGKPWEMTCCIIHAFFAETTKSNKTKMTNSEDIAALKAMKTGDKKEFDWIYKKYFRQLRAFAIKIAGDVAEDIIHDVFAKIWEERETTKITGSLLAYLRKSVYNNCLDHIYHIKIVRKHIEYTWAMADVGDERHTHDNDNPQSLLELQELKNVIGKAIETLPERCKEVFELFEKGFSYQEISERLGISIGSVCKQINRARIKIQQAIDNMG